MYLLDTHTLIWTLFESKKLSFDAKQTIAANRELFVSIASLWEIAIKQGLKKIGISASIREIERNANKAGIFVLDIRASHLDAMKKLPNIHNDPFDRLIIAQALEENLTLITKDSIIPKYNVRTIW